MKGKEEKVLIRSMEPGDIDAVLAIDRKLIGLRRSITYGINEVIGGQFDFSFVSEINGEIIGFVLASVIYFYEPEMVTDACVIQVVGVDPDYWRKGIATKLIQTLLNASRSKGIKKVRVMVDKNDKQLSSFFQRIGFRHGRFISYSIDV
jgi:ribosomal protein S18 acetylase RimI-like enzyme